MKIFSVHMLWLCIVWANYGFAYDRGSYGYKTRTYPKGTPSFYRGIKNCKLQADHVVALKDANDSGANRFSAAQKRLFANDPENLVPACANVNQMKGARAPKDFWRLSNDNKGVDINWTGDRWCAYIRKYYHIKTKYNLSFANNDRKIFKQCNRHINSKR